jgi:CheY-like chemotaxis protein
MRIKKVLLIDDNNVDMYINKHIISKFKIADTIVEKTSAIDALDYLSNQGEGFPELIFLDVRMPEMDGFGFLERYAEFHEQKKGACKIIMLTSSSDSNDIEKARDNPYVVNYLNKPLTENLLFDAFKAIGF